MKSVKDMFIDSMIQHDGDHPENLSKDQRTQLEKRVLFDNSSESNTALSFLEETENSRLEMINDIEKSDDHLSVIKGMRNQILKNLTDLNSHRSVTSNTNGKNVWDGVK